MTTPELVAIATGADRVEVFDRRRDPLEKAPEPVTSPLFVRGRELLRQAKARAASAAELSDSDKAALQALGYVR